MACFRPLEAVQEFPGAVPRISDGIHDRVDGRNLWLPCGRCIGCRVMRQRAWALRCMHEAQMHENNSFVTLTYASGSDGSFDPSLNYLDFQRFMRALRKRVGPTRFFMCGEYGGLTGRPHFHALIFGHSFLLDKLHSSSLISSIWPHGFNYVGEVNYQSASYCARYTCDKVTGQAAEAHYLRVDTRTGELVRVVPEMGRMSLKPGIGYGWFQKYWKEVYGVRDGIVQRGGNVVPPPRYYDSLLSRLPETYNGETGEEFRELLSAERELRASRFAEDSVPARLAVREQCAKARVKFFRKDKL